MTPADVKLLMNDVRALFPGAEKYWTPQEWSVLVEVCQRFGGDYQQALAVVREHRATTDKRTPTIGAIRKQLKACEPVSRPAGPVPGISQPRGEEPTGFLRTVAILSRNEPNHPTVKLARKACAKCPEFAATMRKAGMEVDA
jgi:hypothetical protein